jgi:hypothetical protein
VSTLKYSGAKASDRPPAEPEPSRPAPSCSTCPCYHRSSRAEYDQTCHFGPAVRDTTAPCNRSWPHTLPTDSCWRHPELAARYQKAVAVEVRRNQLEAKNGD